VTVYSKSITLQSRGKWVFHDVTDEVKSVVSNSNIKNGLATVYSPHTTCTVLIQEDCHDASNGTKFLFQDLMDIFERVIPKCQRVGQYRHPGPEHISVTKNRGEDLAWQLNTHAHLRACILCPSQTIPLNDGKLSLGTFQRIYFLDLDDTRARKRSVQVQVVGD